MILYYILTIFANSQPKNDVFGIACLKIIESINSIKDYSLKGLSKICFVSFSTISRLPKKLCYVNLNEFLSHLFNIKSDYLINGQIINTPYDNAEQAYWEIEKSMHDAINTAKQNIDLEMLNNIISLIQQANNICITGSPIPQSAYSLQMELNMKGKRTTAFMNPYSQIEEIELLNDNDLLIIYEVVGQEVLSTYIQNHHKKGNVIIISPHVQLKKVYNTPYFIYYPNKNFTINLFQTNVITNFIIAALQAN